MAVNSYYGTHYYGAEFYGGTGVFVIGHYLYADVNFSAETAKKYLYGDVNLAGTKQKFLVGDVFLEKTARKYIYGDVDLVNTKERYLYGDVYLEAFKRKYLFGRVSFIYGLLPYEVDEFQVIIDRQKVKFYWSDSIVVSNKQYKLYESTDNEKTWDLLDTITDTEYELSSIPFDITKRSYKIVVTSGSLTSYGIVSYPVYSFRRALNVFDNGYWDIDPESNLYKIFEGITKEAHCRAELEKDYTDVDSSIQKIRNARISDVWGTAFDQESATVGEDYRRKIWDLFIGFRNTVTYKGLYHITKAFTHIPPKISKLSEDGWILGRRYLGKDTIPLSELTALYGSFFKIHLPKKVKGSVYAVPDSTTVFDSTATTYRDYLSDSNDYYNGNYLIFKSGNNAYKTRKVLDYSYTPSISSGRFTTEPFPYDTTVGDTFFVSPVDIEVVEDYIRKGMSLHSYLLFKYYPDYISETYETGFAGYLHNMELVPSRRLRVINPDDEYDDDGKIVQAMYDSGNGFARAYPLLDFGAQGVICWDSIEWGDAEIDFKIFVTFSNDLSDWTYAIDRTRYVNFIGIKEEDLAEYIKEGSEVVADTSGGIYVRDVDYLMDYRNGTIRRTITSDIPTDIFVEITYDTEWGEVVQNTTLSFTKEYMRYKLIVNGVKNTSDWEFGGLYVKKLQV